MRHAADQHRNAVAAAAGDDVDALVAAREGITRRIAQLLQRNSLPAAADVDAQTVFDVLDFGFDLVVAELQIVLRQKPPPAD
ncbi:MAG TPA: hypothetical protein VH951_09070 [Dehalococcoidia bacterium]